MTNVQFFYVIFKNSFLWLLFVEFSVSFARRNKTSLTVLRTSSWYLRGIKIRPRFILDLDIHFFIVIPRMNSALAYVPSDRPFFPLNKNEKLLQRKLLRISITKSFAIYYFWKYCPLRSWGIVDHRRLRPKTTRSSNFLCPRVQINRLV